MDINIIKTQDAITTFDGAILAWADATTDPTSDRRKDLLRDKVLAVIDFFLWENKPIEIVTPGDVKKWQEELERQELAPATVYAKISRVSSFYTWAMKAPEVAGRITCNPVTLARPKAPKAYQNERTKALDDDEVRALLNVVKARADSGDVIGKRDYAMLLFYLLTGMRRSEVARLRWGDVKLNGDGLIVAFITKGGLFVNKEINEPSVRAALLDYLQASKRLDSIALNSPLWTRHDRAGMPWQGVTSHGIAKAFKQYAEVAGVEGFHLHALRHTYARAQE
jgi:integrase